MLVATLGTMGGLAFAGAMVFLVLQSGRRGTHAVRNRTFDGGSSTGGWFDGGCFGGGDGGCGGGGDGGGGGC
ncbi:MAG TPA: hypothetical protein VIU11_20810 [Nakamurella sp.]